MTSERTVERITERISLGPDALVDDKALIITAQQPERTDPFVTLSEDWFSSPGFDWHPHRGLETVTLVLDGALEYGDNAGHAGALFPGDVQWLTGGRGVIHRELALGDEHVHTVQLWVNLPAATKMVEARYQNLLASDQPTLSAPGVSVSIVSGQIEGTDGPAANYWPIQAAVVTLQPGSSYAYPLPSSHRAFVHVLTGSVVVQGRSVGPTHTAWSDPVLSGPALGGPALSGPALSVLHLAAFDRQDLPVQLLICSGPPIGEPIAMGGPFVMNTDDEIADAFTDLHAGGFGSVPSLARVAWDR